MSALDISRWADEVGADLGEAALAIKTELFSGVVLNTRVKEGRLRGNWQVSQNAPIYSEIDRFDKEGSVVIDDIENTVTVDGVEFLTNNLPYAEVWNERDGIIDGEFARLDQIIKGAI